MSLAQSVKSRLAIPGEVKSEARVAPCPPAPPRWRIPVRFRAKGGFLAVLGVRFEFVCTQKQFVFALEKR